MMPSFSPKAGRWLALLAAAALAAGCDSPAGPSPAGQPVRVAIVAGDGQVGVVGAELAELLVVKVTDAKGKAVPTQQVTFRVTAGGGSVSAEEAATDRDGMARSRWRLGTVARDTQKVEAVVGGAAGTPVLSPSFVAVGRPGAPAALSRLAGDAQTGAVGSALSDSLAVRLADAYGNAISGQPVSFAVGSGEGSVAPAVGTTDSSGIARTQWTLGARLDTAQAATAAFGALPAVAFAATATAAGTLVAVSGDAQSGVVGRLLGDSLAVRLRLTDGSPVRGATVQWTASAGALVPATSQTDAGGTARAAWLLGTTAGAQSATATVVAGTGSVALRAVGLAGSAETVEPDPHVPRTGVATLPLGDSLRVTVYDHYRNPVPNARIRWSAIASGHVSPDSSRTGSDGVAASLWTLAADVGPQQANAVLAETNDTATFTVTAIQPLGIVPDSSSTPQNDSLFVLARIFAYQPLASVIVSVSGREVRATHVSGTFDRDQWLARVPLAGLPWGEAMRVMVTATDVGGNRATTPAWTVIHDSPPVITVTQPVQDGSMVVVNGDSVHLAATCVDDGPSGCASLVADIGGTEVARGTRSIDVMLPVEPGGRHIYITGIDSRGQSATWDRAMVVNRSPHLRLVASVPGLAWDVDAERVLWRESAGGLRVRSRTTGVDHGVPTPNARPAEAGYLSPAGVLFTAGGEVYEWNGASTADLGTGQSLQVSGAWAAWVSSADSIVVRNLTDASGWSVGPVSPSSTFLSLGPNGVLVYSGDSSFIHVVRNGASSLLRTVMSDRPATELATDGQYVAYRIQSSNYGGFTATFRQSLGLSGTDLLTRLPWVRQPQAGKEYALSNGWVGYILNGEGVRVRGPGVDRALGTTSDSGVDAVGPDGSVVTVERLGARSLHMPGGLVLPVGYWTGHPAAGSLDLDRMFWQDGRWMLVQHASVFEVVP